jgi:Tfp pilus assembly protein PilO
MNLTATQKLIISVVIFVVLFIAAVGLLIVPQASRISSLNAEIEQAESDFEAASLLLERRQEAKARAAVTESELLRLSNEVPESPELPSLVIDLQNTANEADLDFVRVSPGLPEQGEGEQYVTVPIEVTVAGHWAKYVDYLRLLRLNVRQLRIAQFDVVWPDETGVTDDPALTEEEELWVYDHGNRIQADMVIEVYQITGEAAATTATAPPPPSE